MDKGKEEKKGVEKPKPAKKEEPSPEKAKEGKKVETKKPAKKAEIPPETEKPADAAAPSSHKNKKINKMTLAEIEEKLNEMKGTMGSLKSKYAQQLIQRKNILSSPNH